MKQILVLFFLFVTITSKADNFTRIEDVSWDHFGTSFALTTVLYGLNKKVLRLDRFDSIVFSTVESLLISTTYGYVQAFDDGTPINRNKLFWNAIGAGCSVGTTLMFEF